MNATSTSITTGEHLRLARIRSGYSQDDLAKKVNVAQQSIAKWERGAASPCARRMTALAAVIGPLPFHTTTEQADEIRAAAAPVRPAATAGALHELLLAELIINTLQNVLTEEQRLLVGAQLVAAGLQGSTPTRSTERRAAITAAGAA